MRDQRYIGRIDAVGVQSLPDAVDHRLAEIARRGRQLGDGDAAGALLHQGDIGERAADIDADPPRHAIVSCLEATTTAAIMPERRPDGISRLMLFFAIVYTVEGFCQAKVGIIWQPLTHYLKETQGWDTVQIAASLAVLDVPWVVKPLYGMVSDFLPLFGYRRRSYLLLANAGAVAAFLWTTQVLAPAAIVLALLLTAIAMAIASTVCGALLVENGQRLSASAAFINQQWLWFNVAVMVGIARSAAG